MGVITQSMARVLNLKRLVCCKIDVLRGLEPLSSTRRLARTRWYRIACFTDLRHLTLWISHRRVTAEGRFSLDYLPVPASSPIWPVFSCIYSPKLQEPAWYCFILSFLFAPKA